MNIVIITFAALTWPVELVTRLQTIKRSINLTLCVPCFILKCVNDQRDAQFLKSILFHRFLSALHVSKESSRSSSGARHNILYHTVWYNRAGESSCN